VDRLRGCDGHQLRLLAALAPLVTALVVVRQSAPPATVGITKVLSPYYQF